MNGGTSLTPARLAHHIKAWGEKLYITFSNSSLRELFRLVLKSSKTGRKVGLSMLDNTFSGWGINHTENGLKCVKIEKNEEKQEVMLLGGSDISCSVPVKGVDGEGKDCFTTQKFVEGDIEKALTTAKSYTDSKIPHLYLHQMHYDRSGIGEVNFTIYDANSSKMYDTTSKVATFLSRIGCLERWKAYPATGMSLNSNYVKGIYASENVSFIAYAIESSTALDSYTDNVTETIIQIF